MRISEIQLRRLVQQALNEMPLKNVEPMRNLQSRRGKQYGAIAKVFGSPNFVRKLQNFLSSWSTNFYVAPMYGRELFPDGERIKVLLFEDFFEYLEEENKKTLLSALKSYQNTADPHSDCLIIPTANVMSPAITLTPWMIFHAIFDSGEDALLKRLFPTALKIRKSVEFEVDKLSNEIYDLLGKGTQEVWDEIPLLLEKIFTFGSARAKFFTKIVGGSFADVGAESAVQSFLKDGFRYNPEAIDEIASIVPGLNAKKHKASFDKIVELSSQAKAEADSNLRGKVMIINVAFNPNT